MNHYRECKLGEIAEINMGQSPKSEFYNQNKVGIPFLQGNRTFGLKYPYFDTYCSKPTKIAKKGEVLFSVRAPVGDINMTNDEICIGRGLCSMNAKNGNNEFLYYLLQHLKSQIINRESGTVFGSVNKTDLSNIDVSYPPLAEQQKIAHILSSLDDKIDLLHRQNQTLEELSQLLFTQTFIKEAKEDWEEVKLGNLDIYISDYVANGSFASLKENVTLIPDNKDFALFIRNTDIKSNFVNKVYVNEHSYNFLKKTKLFGGEILISNVGDVGSIFRCPEMNQPMTLGNNMIMLNSEYNLFLYLLFKNKLGQNLIGNITSGSVQQKFNKTDFKNLKIRFKNIQQIRDFNQLVSNYFQKIDLNKKEIQTLTDLRDTLLPKLMNGELRVGV